MAVSFACQSPYAPFPGVAPVCECARGRYLCVCHSGGDGHCARRPVVGALCVQLVRARHGTLSGVNILAISDNALFFRALRCLVPRLVFGNSCLDLYTPSTFCWLGNAGRAHTAAAAERAIPRLFHCGAGATTAARRCVLFHCDCDRPALVWTRRGCVTRVYLRCSPCERACSGMRYPTQ